MADPRFVIAGAGPAGMTLAYVLASNGCQVTVLERHPEFEREFRGELVQRSSVEALEKLGAIKALIDRGVALPSIERRLLVGPTREVMKAFRRGEKGMIIAQPPFLEFMHQQAKRFPGYSLQMGTTVTEAVVEGGRVVAFKTRGGSGEGRVEGDVFIATTGRKSALRKVPGVEVEEFEQPADALWIRFDFSDAPELLPKGVDVHMWGHGVVVAIQPTTKNRLQIAYSAPGDLTKLRKDLPAFRAALMPTIPEMIRPIIDAQLDEKTPWQLLRIGIDRLKKWHVPGLLFLGDAAHTMSPSGGQGINLAIRDAIVASNFIVDAVKAGKAVDENVFAAIEAARRPEVTAAQSQQLRAGRSVMKPIGGIHALMTMISSMIWLFTLGGRKLPHSTPVEFKYPVSVSEV